MKPSECLHEWNITGTPAMFVIVCSRPDCAEELTLDEAEAMLNDHTALKQALTLIGDIGYDYDGYGSPHDLKKLIDEMVGYARNPQLAVDALTKGDYNDDEVHSSDKFPLDRDH